MVDYIILLELFFAPAGRSTVRFVVLVCFLNVSKPLNPSKTSGNLKSRQHFKKKTWKFQRGRRGGEKGGETGGEERGLSLPFPLSLPSLFPSPFLLSSSLLSLPSLLPLFHINYFIFPDFWLNHFFSADPHPPTPLDSHFS